MIPTVDRLNQSIGIGAAPSVGSVGSLLGPSNLDDIRKRLQSPSDEQTLLSQANTLQEMSAGIGEDEDDEMLGIDEELELETEIDMKPLAQEMMNVVEAPEPAKQTSTPTPASAPEDETSCTEEDNYEVEDEEESSSYESQPQKSNNKILLIVAALVVLVVVIFVIFKPSGTTQASTTQGQPSVNKYANDQITPTDGTTYQDSMVIDKYFILEQDTCIFIFEGYAENARAFIQASVDIDTYNKYKIGARVPVIYERVELSGKQYYMKVRII